MSYVKVIFAPTGLMTHVLPGREEGGAVFTCTIGLTSTFMHSDIVVFDLAREKARTILSA